MATCGLPAPSPMNDALPQDSQQSFAKKAFICGPSWPSFLRCILMDANATPEVASQWPWGSTDVATDLARSRIQSTTTGFRTRRQSNTVLALCPPAESNDASCRSRDEDRRPFQQLVHQTRVCGRPYYFALNILDVNNRRVEPSIAYWSFMNIRGSHALVDDTGISLICSGVLDEQSN
ncbi:hypothetical protein B0H13DRAFT_2423758 [Mycena leptocephala]|nr:hypothetical protein B0H13DRAFT_2423758 [Mycena leptocephala]